MPRTGHLVAMSLSAAVGSTGPVAFFPRFLDQRHTVFVAN
jgi:hypothetical protein